MLEREVYYLAFDLTSVYSHSFTTVRHSSIAVMYSICRPFLIKLSTNLKLEYRETSIKVRQEFGTA